MNERRPSLAALVRGRPHRRYHRCGDLPGEPIGRAVTRLYQRDIEGAQPNWLARDRDNQSVIGKAVAASDIGRRFAADQLRAGTIGDQRGIQRVVEVRVHRDDRR